MGFMKERLYAEANANTAAIMHYLETHVADEALLTDARKRIGDILHRSRRRVLRDLEEHYGQADRG